MIPIMKKKKKQIIKSFKAKQLTVDHMNIHKELECQLIMIRIMNIKIIHKLAELCLSKILQL